MQEQPHDSGSPPPAPPLPSLGPPQLPALGSLAQSARKKELRTARWILIAIGFLTILGNGLLLLNVEHEVSTLIRMQREQHDPSIAAFSDAQMENYRQMVTRFAALIYLGSMGVGVLFICLGIFIYVHPVAMTVSGLVVYVAMGLILFLMNPATLLSGILFKILFIVALGKSVQAAVAYQRAAAQAPAV